MAIKERQTQNIEFIREIAKTELDDVHVLSHKTAAQVLTDERVRLLKAIETGDAENERAAGRSP